MIKPLLTALMLLIFCDCYCQQNQDSLYLKNLKSQIISPDYKNNGISDLPFKAIHVLDARPDTGSIGFLKTPYLIYPQKLVFANGLSNEVLKFGANNYRLNNDSSFNELLIVIKQYRFSDYIKSASAKQYNPVRWGRGIIVSAELFIQDSNNTYHALYKVDSSCANNSNSLNTLVQQSFKLLFDKVSNQTLSQLHIGRTSFSYADIQQHIESFFKYAILKDSTLKKGVYKNFVEFKSNNPSITNYEFQSGKLSDEIFVTENNQTYPLHDFWGFCDGKKTYINSAGNCFELIKTGNTFNTKAAKSIDLINSPDIGNMALAGVMAESTPNSDAVSVPNKSKFKLNTSALQLNMQTGELY